MSESVPDIETGSEGQSHEPVYRALRDAILRGDVRPGERMVVKRIADEHEISALPVRHALQRLVGEGALQEEPYRGVRVPIRSVEELIDLRRVRCAIEGQAAEWAALSVTGREIEQLHDLQARLRHSQLTGDAERYLEWNFEFHFTVYRAARSALLVPMIERLWLRVGPYLNAMRTSLTLGDGLDMHDMVLDALARGDGATARRGIEADISNAAGILVRGLVEALNGEAAE